MKAFRLDRYWVFNILNLIAYVAIGIIAWYLSGYWTALIVIIFVAFYLMTVLNFYTHFIANDYQYLEDITIVNQRVKVHNAHLDLVKKEMEDVKAAIQSGAINQGMGKNLTDKAAEMIKKNTITNVVPRNVKNVETPTDNAWGGSNTNANTTGAKVNITVKPIVQPTPAPLKPVPIVPKKPVVNENDSIVEEEMARDKAGPTKKKKADEIYEGGEAEAMTVTDIIVDPDEEEVVDSRTRVKYSNVADWRLENNFLTAFWKGQLRKNDYQIIFSSILSGTLLAVGAWLVCTA